MATFMMKSRRSSQGLLLLCLLVLTFSVIPAPISVSGESIIDSDRKSKFTIGANKAAVIHDDIYNGCIPHNVTASNICCTKDNLCWPSMSECVINCPCKVRCD